jgi:hypothetical protein
MHEWTERAQQEAQAKVFSMAASDPEFRALALRDGRAAVEKASGMRLPEGFNIRFVDPAGAHITRVLPEAAYEETELSEFELMAVAGGKGGKRKPASETSSGSDDPNDLTISGMRVRE